MIETTYTNARANLANLLSEVIDNRETVIISRRGAEKVAMIAADELSSLLETAYLLRSPRNAKRLIDAIELAKKGTTPPQSLEDFAREVGLVK